MHSRESDHFSLDGALEKENWAFLSAKSHVSFLVFHYAPTMPLSAGRRRQRILRRLVPIFRSGPEGVLQYS